ncbi:WXG100 family type VII secretion target [Mycobacteroides saopaulense]|uniref:WXG100 family type VII secretion target n=1 Tax=Mycobacteroides saopaulense TaxID=1578165 RepID=A0ABX3BWF5_9MYCO|nr:WXG100 family type VII secretion target [Mycobacteroides saopaulense]OHT81180.1 hypothetical protein BKG68_23345 [Mycobacteroides saopaulense]OHU07329.1 hypothetical protein BKG73_18950 [Mycobacteroides saopaulense]
MGLKVSHSEALAKMKNVRSEVNSIQDVLKQWQVEGETMTTSNWQGASAQKFGQGQEEHLSEFNAIIAKLEETVDYSDESLNDFINRDSEH